LLASVLAGRGYEVYIGNKIQHTALDKIDPDVYFESSAKDHADRFEWLRENGVNTLVLETEGSGFAGVEEFSKVVGAETLEHTDCYCAWGSVAKEAVKSVSPETPVELTGNPRFDLVQEPYRNFYSRDAERLKAEYGEFILFNTNYSLANGERSVKSLFSHKDDSEKAYTGEFLKSQTKILGEFIRLIAETAERFPERNVIIRPHPGENPALYENSMYGYDNVTVEKRLEVRPWILAAEAVVHNSCTTGVESALLGTPVIGYVPDGLEVLPVPNNVSDRCETVTAVCDMLQQSLTKERIHALNDEREAEIKQYIDNTDYLSVERIADVVDSVLTNETDRTALDVDTKLRVRRWLVRALGSKRFEEVYVKGFRGESRHKFPYTSTDEVQSIVEQFDDRIKPSGLRIERLPYMVNGFRFKCNT
jgi:surface carbohydrate biosynthesis protein